MLVDFFTKSSFHFTSSGICSLHSTFIIVYGISNHSSVLIIPNDSGVQGCMSKNRTVFYHGSDEFVDCMFNIKICIYSLGKIGYISEFE